jgi:arylsulfatase A-like enzyme
MKSRRFFYHLTLLLAPLVTLHAASPVPSKPNIIILLADDLGYADLGCQGSKEVISPNIDSIAANGVRCTAGYVTAPQCCPSRAGLMTGRYQNRFGFEANPPPSVEAKVGLPVSERTLANRLKAAGYATGMIGKWHLGHLEPLKPYNRGFDETYWHPHGGVLFPNSKTGFIPNLYCGKNPVNEPEYSTDAFGREAVAFIDRHQREPFFLYLAFVPPHWPMQAKPEHLAKFAHIPDLHRRTMLGMMASLDENVGHILAKLRETKLDDNTLIFFLSDNGGPTGHARPQPDADFEYGRNTSKNDPLRGVKGDLFEGGIRVPFLVQWKGHIPAGKTYGKPVISLDIAPTALALAGVTPQPEWKLDGTNLLPFLTGEDAAAPHDTLFWRFRLPLPPANPGREGWAMRQGDWKLVKNARESLRVSGIGGDSLSLYNLVSDIGETKDLSVEQPERVAAMAAAYKQWDAQNMKPRWGAEPPAVAKPESAILRSTSQAKVKVVATEITTTCTGNDTQLVFTPAPAARGPFTLELKMRSTAKGPAQVFWSMDEKPNFPPKQSIIFEPDHEGKEWKNYTLKLPTDSLKYLRFDPSSAPGLARIAQVVLKDVEGKVVKAWIGSVAK